MTLVWPCREQQLEELMEKLKIAEQEREQLARHNMLLERAIIARDRVSADFGEAKAADLEEAKVCHHSPRSDCTLAFLCVLDGAGLMPCRPTPSGQISDTGRQNVCAHPCHRIVGKVQALASC